MITKQDVQKVIDKEIQDDINAEKVFNLIRPFVVAENGKKIDGWLKKRLEKSLPDYRIESSFSFFCIVPKNPIIGVYRSFNITYSNIVDLAFFDKSNSWCQEKEHGRIAKNRAISDETKEKFSRILNAITHAGDFLENEVNSFDIPAFFPIQCLSKYEIKKRR